MKRIWLFLPLLLAGHCNRTQPPAASASPFVLPIPQRICGLTVVAPPEPFPQNPMPAVQAVGANWIAVVPYAYTMPGKAAVRYNEHGWQWWGEKPEGTLATIEMAHQAGVKVMLKPQVYVPGGWTGTLDFETPADWAAWEAGYSAYILQMARLADAAGVELFCIGTEFRTAIAKRPAYWFDLIQQIRTVYPNGKLVYSSNWDDWDQVPFWDRLDYIGMGAYFPMTDEKLPTVDILLDAWKPMCNRLGTFSKQHQKPVLFTEYGYLSVDGCGGKNWELENNITARNINEAAQANCYEALFKACMHEPWWAGGFTWKWFPNGRGHEGYPERDYTPQGKQAEAVLRKWYSTTQ